MKLFLDKTLDQHTNALASFLPTGKVFDSKYQEGTVLRDFLKGIGVEIASLYDSFNSCSEDHDINNTVELINEWESAVGIPDNCFDGKGTLPQRRLAVLIKLAKMNVQTVEDMRLLAVALGFDDAVITPLSQSSLPPVNVPFIPSNPPDSRYVIQITATGAVTNVPPYDVPFIPSNENGSVLACVMSIVKPANTRVIFSNVPLPAFSPINFNAVGWYDASDINTFTLDGNLINEWSNKGSGVGGDLIKFDNSSRPCYVATFLNGRPVVKFLGFNHLKTTIGSILNSPTNDNTIVCLFKKNTSCKLEFVLSWLYQDAIKQSIVVQKDNIPEKAQEVISQEYIENEFNIVVCTKGNGVETLQVDDGTIYTKQSTDILNSPDLFNVGSFQGGLYLNGEIAEIIIFPKLLTDSEQITMKNYLNTKWGL